MTVGPAAGTLATDGFGATVAARIRLGARLGGLFALPEGDGTRLVAVVSDDGALATVETVLGHGVTGYPSLTPDVPAAAWYEREIHDLFGLEPIGHPRLDPLVLPLGPGVAPPRPGSGKPPVALEPDLTPLPAHVHGEGVFTIPYGPVRSGVFEAVEYVVETAGEDIPHLRTRVFYKHRGIDARFCELGVEDGVLLAERAEGVASVAHAIAYCSAVERLAGAQVPHAAELVRVVHAELERIANHLDTMVRHAEAAGQAVAYARLSLHKERVQRLRARLCGSRFGRGVVVPGGVAVPLHLGADELLGAVHALQRGMRDDTDLLMGTPSFVDRLRGTGVLSPEVALAGAALGPVGRASEQPEDVRTSRPYGAYRRLGHRLFPLPTDGDALARQRVRLGEIDGSFQLVRQAVDVLDQTGEPPAWRVPAAPAGGRELGWAEAPQGEVLSLVEVDGGRLVRVKQRSASFHNLALFPAAFPKDIFTDFAFVEASFGLSMAGAAG
jgi:formate hydrogenlyase subunit 5